MAKSSLARKIQSEPRPRIPVESKGGEIATNLDRLLHDRMRLGIVSALAAGDELSFTDLKAALNATDGNLSVHARKLEEAGYVACNKTFAGRTPRTDYKLTAAGRRAFEKYLDHMDALIKAARRF
ncbi:MAG TPA: transcriptional regulator [Vicinamibacterales bacterium]|nr:transcriptional regulator [Vicinamibacterales bacterium]